MLDDYIILAKSQVRRCFGLITHPSLLMAHSLQCNLQTRTGVCPDSLLGGSNNLELLMSSYIDGLIKVTFKRPLRTLDIAYDIPLVVNKHVYVLAAIGTLDAAKLPNYHTVAVSSKYHLGKFKPVNSLDFGRPHSARNCAPPLWQQMVTQSVNAFNSFPGSQAAEAEAHSLFEIEPWKPAIIKAANNHVFRVVLGPTGNSMQGYTSITGIESPGIAYWVDDLLIPEIHVTRGFNYTFIVETGSNSSDKAHYHPFYITDSREGGGALRPELLNTPGNRIYAGVDTRWGMADPRPGTGRYCELAVNKQMERDLRAEGFAINSIAQFRKALTLNCEVSGGGKGERGVERLN